MQSFETGNISSLPVEPCMSAMLMASGLTGGNNESQARGKSEVPRLASDELGQTNFSDIASQVKNYTSGADRVNPNRRIR